MQTRDLLYDLLQDKIRGQIFYNELMIRMVNPLARDLFRTFRDEDERQALAVLKQFLAVESKPAILKAFLPARKPLD
ncbi:MAG: hypothetical protein K6T66_03660 [Peptococcaceae bacterium]|nr:hypothetical protein [Peptococcaceae bacterium]